MAIINKTGITNGGTIQAEHVTRAIDALSGGSTDTVVATGSFSGSLTGVATSASFATTASFALNAGGGSGVGFPFTGSARITGSLVVTGSFVQRTSGQLLITSDTNSTMSIYHDVLNLSSEEVNVDNDVYFGNRGGLDLTAMKNFMGLRIPLDPPSTGLTTTGSMYFDALNLTLYIHDGTQWTYITLST